MSISHGSMLIMVSATPVLSLIAQSQRRNSAVCTGILLALCATSCSVAMGTRLLLLEGPAHIPYVVHMELGCKVQSKRAKTGSSTSHSCPYEALLWQTTSC